MVDDARNRFYGRFRAYEGVYPAMNVLETSHPRFNARFEREPREPEDLHRPLPKGVNMEEIFYLKTVRTILDGYIIR